MEFISKSSFTSTIVTAILITADLNLSNNVIHVSRVQEEDRIVSVDNSGKFKRRFICQVGPILDEVLRSLLIKKCYISIRLKLLSPVEPSKLYHYRDVDLHWVFSFYLDIQITLAWVGYNSKLYSDYLPVQRIAYLKAINQSPTSLAVIKKTLDNSLKVKNELKTKYIEVTFDLAIAMKAYKIINAYPELYKTIFIHIGFFHLEFAFFHALGKLIDESGIEVIMVQSEIIAPGSVNGFMSGKHFNRCKRLHQVLYMALHKLLLKLFLDKERCNFSHDAAEILEAFQRRRQAGPCVEKCDDESICDITAKYVVFKQRVMDGEFSRTAQFFFQYLNWMDYYFQLSRSVRFGDFELLKYSITKICNLFLQ